PLTRTSAPPSIPKSTSLHDRSAPPSNPPSTLTASLLIMLPPPPRSTLFPYTTLFRSVIERITLGRLAEEMREVEFEIDLGKKDRSEEHTSELQSRSDLVCRLLLEKKKVGF